MPGQAFSTGAGQPPSQTAIVRNEQPAIIAEGIIVKLPATFICISGPNILNTCNFNLLKNTEEIDVTVNETLIMLKLCFCYCSAAVVTLFIMKYFIFFNLLL